MTDPIALQLQDAVRKEAPKPPKPLDAPDRPGWWLRHDSTDETPLYISQEDIEDDDDLPPGDWYGPLREQIPEPTLAPEDVPPAFADRLKRFVELELLRRRLEDELKETKAKAAMIGKNLIEDFSEQHTQSMRSGGLTCYLKTNWYVSKAKGVEKQEICDRLCRIGREDLVKDGYAANSLKAWVLEQLTRRQEIQRMLADFAKQGTDPPSELSSQLEEIAAIDPLLPLLNIGSQLTLATRK